MKKAEEAAAALKGRVAPISVTLMQLMTSSHAEPDTRAMTCVGSLNTAGKVSITEVQTSSSKPGVIKEPEAIEAITVTIVNNLTAVRVTLNPPNCPP